MRRLLGWMSGVWVGGPSAVLASEGGAEFGMTTVDAMTALWTIIVFIILALLLKWKAWGPIQDVLVKRERFIADSLEQAKREREEAQELLAGYKRQLELARGEASEIVAEARRDAEALKRKLDEQARQEADAMLERAKREIRLAGEAAVKNLYDRSADLSIEIARRLIGKEIDAGVHEQLIRNSIEELEGMSRN